MPPRTIALISAVSLTIGWLLASVMTPPVARVQVLAERGSVPAPGNAESVAPFTALLQVRLRRTPQPPTPRRNPFAFGNRSRPADTTMTASPAPAAAPIAPVVVGPTFTLSGVGVSDTAGGPLYTAVLSDGNTVHLLKAGDTIGRYQVVEVNDHSVTLTDPSAARYVLRLKH